jgi:hypothetical protein
VRAVLKRRLLRNFLVSAVALILSLIVSLLIALVLSYFGSLSKAALVGCGCVAFYW